jgi:glucose/arabinose dehydrogenase
VLFAMPRAHFSDPEFSWKWAVPPGGIGFVDGDGLGAEFAGDLFVGGAKTPAAAASERLTRRAPRTAAGCR